MIQLWVPFANRDVPDAKGLGRGTLPGRGEAGTETQAFSSQVSVLPPSQASPRARPRNAVRC